MRHEVSPAWNTLPSPPCLSLGNHIMWCQLRIYLLQKRHPNAFSLSSPNTLEISPPLGLPQPELSEGRGWMEASLLLQLRGLTPQMRWNECMRDGLDPMEELLRTPALPAPGHLGDGFSYHCEVKSTNSSENLSAGSCGDGSSTTCLSCWKGVPHES